MRAGSPEPSDPLGVPKLTCACAVWPGVVCKCGEDQPFLPAGAPVVANAFVPTRIRAPATAMAAEVRFRMFVGAKYAFTKANAGSESRTIGLALSAKALLEVSARFPCANRRPRSVSTPIQHQGCVLAEDARNPICPAQPDRERAVSHAPGQVPRSSVPSSAKLSLLLVTRQAPAMFRSGCDKALAYQRSNQRDT